MGKVRGKTDVRDSRVGCCWTAAGILREADGDRAGERRAVDEVNGEDETREAPGAATCQTPSHAPGSHVLHARSKIGRAHV